jgi:hypothetical protein
LAEICKKQLSSFDEWINQAFLSIQQDQGKGHHLMVLAAFNTYGSLTKHHQDSDVTLDPFRCILYNLGLKINPPKSHLSSIYVSKFLYFILSRIPFLPVFHSEFPITKICYTQFAVWCAKDVM